MPQPTRRARFESTNPAVTETTLLRHIAAHNSGYDGVAQRLPAGRDWAGFTALQRLVAELFTSCPPVKPTAPAAGGGPAVIVLDDVILDPDQVHMHLLRVLPGCSLVLGSPQPVLGRHGTALAGGPNHAAIQ